MPQKPRTPQPQAPLLWKQELACSEGQVLASARSLAAEVRVHDRILLEGPMGAGKTTFARSLLESMGVVQPPEGSPTFALAHEYESAVGGVVHIDFYRIRFEEELEQSGLQSYFWERDAVVISEWISLWSDFERAVVEDCKRRQGTVWKVNLDFADDPTARKLSIERY